MKELVEKSKEWFGENFGDLLAQIKTYAKKAGRFATKPILELYFVLREENTPLADKALIVGALAYLFVPVDLIPFRKFGLLGILDESVAISYAYKKMKKLITPQIEFEVERILDEWFEGISIQMIEE